MIAIRKPCGRGASPCAQNTEEKMNSAVPIGSPVLLSGNVGSLEPGVLRLGAQAPAKLLGQPIHDPATAQFDLRAVKRVIIGAEPHAKRD